MQYPLQKELPITGKYQNKEDWVFNPFLKNHIDKYTLQHYNKHDKLTWQKEIYYEYYNGKFL